IQNMMPKDTEGVYGKGLAGDMWKSQMAEQLANVMAARGGIGIARSLLADHYMDGKRIVPVGPVSGGPEKAEIDQQIRLSTSMVQELQ
ncbi:MAG: flagellar biosynthesis protein FlgJ, partial [Mesorhizobium sp.]